MTDSKKPNTGTQVPFLPSDLPFNDDQKQWLGGFLAGLHSRLLVQEQGSAPAQAGPSTHVAAKPITIIYGSQTGNAESMAELAGELAANHGLSASVKDMADVSVDELANSERLLVVTSTYGEGEMPDNAQTLWDEISAEGAPSFANSHFSVLALGDTSYDGFCVAGQLWDERLEQLGAKRVADRVDCDVEFEEAAQGWIDAVLPAISAKGTQSGVETAQASTDAAPKKAKSAYNRKNPLPAKLTAKRVLTGSESSKEICHFEFSLGDSGETYEAGDAINIITPNRPDLVSELIELLDANASDDIDGKTLESLLKDELEIRTPSRELLAEIAKQSPDSELNALLAANDNNALNDYLWGKDVVDLLRAHGDVRLSGAAFVGLSKKLMPRAYSISSSINKHDNEVHLTIGSVRYNSNDRDHNGVCSTYLADIANVGDEVACFFAPNKSFAVPADSNLPMIMVGPGTGIAPFRAFLEEREATGAKGDNWLFFGDRNAKSDFIYQDEIEAWQQSGLLTQLDLAFSRDQAEKIYVQDRMREHGAQLYAWLEKGAYFYVCGDASRMAKDVDQALLDVICEHGGKNLEEANAYVTDLKKQKRYVRDVY